MVGGVGVVEAGINDLCTVGGVTGKCVQFPPCPDTGTSFLIVTDQAALNTACTANGGATTPDWKCCGTPPATPATPPPATDCRGKATPTSLPADGNCVITPPACANPLTEDVATKQCSLVQTCCRTVAPPATTKCSGTDSHNNNAVTDGVCGISDCPATFLTATAPELQKCRDALNAQTGGIYCCKVQQATTTYQKCATATEPEKAIGGVCSPDAGCPTATPDDKTSQVTKTECVTPNKKCCKAAVAPGDNKTPTSPEQNPASTTTEAAGKFAEAFAWLVSLLIQLGGAILLAVFELIVKVSQFNDIINSYYVVQGWIVLRDLVNMFFVLGLLFIAFVTVLKIEKYQWQKLLPKLLIMAIVVNFSRTICGLIIDFFQVMMFTFVNAFKDIAGQNLFKGLGLSDMWDQIGKDAPNGAMAMIAGRLLGLVYVIVALIVTVIFLIILVFRIIILWVLVVFSPLAFFSAAFSGISAKVGSYWTKWFSTFIEYCMVGPLMAFFLWLSILSLGSDYTTMYAQRMSPGVGTQGQESLLGSSGAVPATPGVTNNKAGRLDYIMKYILGILMLVAGLKFTSEMKVMGASMAGKAAGKIQDAAIGRAERLAKGGYDLGKKYTGMGVKEGLGNLERRGGFTGAIAKGARLIGTKEGRQMMGERTAARIQAHIGGQKGALEEQRQKEQDRYGKQYKLMGVAENPEMMKAELAKATGDRKVALMDILGDEGKMTKKQYQQSLEAGDFKHLGVKTKKNEDTGEIEVDFKESKQGGLANLEKKVKKWEKAYETKTNLPIALSPYTRNPITNQWEETGSGKPGEKKKLKDAEDSLAKKNAANLQQGISNGDFANTGDLMTNIAHLSGVGRNDYLKNAGHDAHDKFRDITDDTMTRLTGSDIEQRAVAEKMAKEKGLDAPGKETEKAKYIADQLADNLRVRESGDIDVKTMKNIQKGYEVSTGDWEPGSGRGTIGPSHHTLAEQIRDKQKDKRKLYNAAKVAEPGVLGKFDELIPEQLQKFQSFPVKQQVAGIRQYFNAALGEEKSAKITDEVIEESIKEGPDIIGQSKEKTNLSGSITSALNSAAALARTGGDKSQVDEAVATLLSTIRAGEITVDSAGMSPEYFKFDKLRKLADDMKTMAGKSKEAQQDIINKIAENAQADGYFNGRLPTFKEKKGAQAAPEPAPIGPVPIHYDTSGRPGGGGGGAAPAPAPAAAAVNIVNVNNITQNLKETTQAILNPIKNNDALIENLRLTIKPLLERSMSDLKTSLGGQFDASVKAGVTKKFEALESAIAGSTDFKANKSKLETELPKLIEEMRKLETTKA